MTSVGETVRGITMIFNRLLGLIGCFDSAKVLDSCSQACRKKVGDRQTDRHTDTHTDTQTDRQTDAADYYIVAPWEGATITSPRRK